MFSSYLHDDVTYLYNMSIVHLLPTYERKLGTSHKKCEEGRDTINKKYFETFENNVIWLLPSSSPSEIVNVKIRRVK